MDRIQENGKDDVMPTKNEPGATGTAAYQNSQENVNSTSAVAPVTEGRASAEGLQTGRPARTSCDRSDSLESLGSNFSGKEEIPHLTVNIFPHNISNYTSGGSRISQRGDANFLRCQLTSVTSHHFTINKQKLHM